MPLTREEKEKQEFSIIARLRSSAHALRGIGILFKTGHNMWVGTFFAALTGVLGFVLGISSTEWLAVILVIGLVLVAEAINTAIEIDIDLTSPEYHPYARDTKDVAAGAVLLSVFVAVIVGAIVFVPKIYSVLK